MCVKGKILQRFDNPWIRNNQRPKWGWRGRKRSGPARRRGGAGGIEEEPETTGGDDSRRPGRDQAAGCGRAMRPRKPYRIRRVEWGRAGRVRRAGCGGSGAGDDRGPQSQKPAGTAIGMRTCRPRQSWRGGWISGCRRPDSNGGRFTPGSHEVRKARASRLVGKDVEKMVGKDVEKEEPRHPEKTGIRRGSSRKEEDACDGRL